MNNHDLKKGISRGFDQLSGHIERKTINTDAVPALLEQERKELFEVDRPRLTFTYYSCRALCVLAVFLLLTGCFTYVYQVREYTAIHIEVNPSLTIYLKGSKIARIKADNKDAEPIIDGINNKESIDQAINLILKRIKGRGYFDHPNADLKIKIQGKDKDQFKKKVAIQVQKTLGELQVTAQVQINRENPEDIASLKEGRNLSDTDQTRTDDTRVEDSSGPNKEENTAQADEQTSEPASVNNAEMAEEEDKTTSELNTASESETASDSKTAPTEMNNQDDSDHLSQSNKESLDQGDEKKISTKSDISRKTKQKKNNRKKSKKTSPKKKETKKKETKKKETRKKKSEKNTSKKQRKKSSKKVKKKQKGNKNSTSSDTKVSSNTKSNNGAAGQAIKEVVTENKENTKKENESALNEGADEDQKSSEENDTGQ